jgi:protein-tyrosine phosphatase
MGNLCRSPLAEAVFRHKARQRGVEHLVQVDSAGTGDWHVGQGADERARAVAARRGITLDGSGRQVCRDDFARHDDIICMDEDNREALLAMGAPAEKVHLLLEFDPNATMIEVPDPYYGDEGGFELVYRVIDSACEALLASLIAQFDADGTPTGQGRDE